MNAAIEIGNSRIKVLRSDGVHSAWSSAHFDPEAFVTALHPVRNVVLSISNPRQAEPIRGLIDTHIVVLDARECIAKCSLPLAIKAQGIGPDRVLGALGSLRYEKPPFVVADCGSATTLTLVDEQRCIIGGYIFPGFGIQLLSLQETISHLPKLTPTKHTIAPGDTTADAMHAGVLLNISMAIVGAYRTACRMWNTHNVALMLTGGFSSLVIDAIAQEVCQFRHVSHLVLEGALSLLE